MQPVDHFFPLEFCEREGIFPHGGKFFLKRRYMFCINTKFGVRYRRVHRSAVD